MPRSWRNVILLGLWAVLAARTAVAQHEHSSGEFEVFVAGEAQSGSVHARGPNDDSGIEADVIFAFSHEQFRVFGEYFLGPPQEHDLERFQVGYEFASDTMLWLGRFHQPASAWNTEHHHGRYLQMAITRPSIESWEDDEGLIPQHITGALIESRRPLGKEGGLQFSGGVGAAPVLTSEGYEPIDLLDNNPGRHGLSLTARLAYLPEYVGTSSAGLLWGHDQLFLRNRAVLAALRSNHAELSIYGAYADWSVDQWRFIGSVYFIDVDFDRPTPNESFVSGYVQTERQLPHRLTAFGRIEDSARMQYSRYVALFDDHSGDIDITLRRAALGLRWDYAHRQALTCEFAHVVSLDQRAFEVRLQWAAAIP